MRNSYVAFCAVVVVCMIGSATVKAAPIQANCITVDPYSFSPTLYYAGTTASGGAGTIEFSGVSTNPIGFNGTFYTYCIDLIQNVYVGGGGPYYFTVTDLQDAPQSGAYAPPQSGGMGAIKAGEIETLYQEDYSSTLPNGGSSDTALDDNKQAFQLAIWNIIYDNDCSVDSGAGSFYVVSGVDSNAISIADTWLKAATDLTKQETFTGGTLFGLVAADNAQDQIGVFPEGTVNPNTSVPLPSVAGTGMMLLAGVGAGFFARRRQVIAG